MLFETTWQIGAAMHAERKAARVIVLLYVPYVNSDYLSNSFRHMYEVLKESLLKRQAGFSRNACASARAIQIVKETSSVSLSKIWATTMYKGMQIVSLFLLHIFETSAPIGM